MKTIVNPIIELFGAIEKKSRRLPTSVPRCRVSMEKQMDVFADSPENLGAYSGPIRGKDPKKPKSFWFFVVR